MNKTKLLIYSAIFASLTAVCSWINIPLFFTPVPINLATFSCMLAGLLLGVKYGTFSQLIYVLLGAIGLPVFAGFTGGLGIVAGPTVGFIIGYIACALVCGFAQKKTDYIKILFMAIGMICCYLLGLLWFMHVTGSGLVAGLLSCVVPFLFGDIVKIVLALFVSKKLEKLI